ncbi:MAG: sigma-70 family RNA polymerase sigma factor [Verrucomicrobiaceae bacterium]|nr:sigma-70 family RNA polymerase sigma factor [Verrucomicrobiaceae bacterium]
MAESSPKDDGRFPTTAWTLVERLKNSDTKVSTRALNDLCAQYHYPLYSFIRWRGVSHHDAEDVLHNFMAKLLRLNAFQNLDEDKGRLRTFLVRSLDRFLISHHHRENRREAREVLAEDLCLVLGPELEQRYQAEASPASLGPDVMFDRRWCAELLTRVLRTLEVEFSDKGKAAVFRVLRPVLLTGGSLRGHDAAAMAASLEMSQEALRTTLLRMLREYRVLLREEVRQTVGSNEDVDAELQHLMQVVSQT